MSGKVTDDARGQWKAILPKLGIAPKFLTKRQCPCPICGGNKRFIFSDRHKDGDYLCRHCGAGKGLGLVMKVNGWDAKTAVKAIRQVIGGSYRPEPMDEAHQAARKFFDAQPDFVPGQVTVLEVLQDDSISFDVAMGVVADIQMRRGKHGEPPKSTKDAALWLRKFHPERLEAWLDKRPEVRWWLENQE